MAKVKKKEAKKAVDEFMAQHLEVNGLPLLIGQHLIIK